MGLALDSLGLSGRAHDRVLKVARTVADLAGSTLVDLPHIAEAVGFRIARGEDGRCLV